jgi:hypothetical protein
MTDTSPEPLPSSDEALRKAVGLARHAEEVWMKSGHLDDDVPQEAKFAASISRTWSAIAGQLARREVEQRARSF